MRTNELVIIGAGAAGLTAAIYAARAGIDFTVLEQDGWGGGQIVSAHTVENYPGVPFVSGVDLGDKIKDQAVALGANIEFAIVDSVKDFGSHKEILTTDGEKLHAKAVIAATGAIPRKLGLENEARFTGKGISYCAVCDGAFFAGKDVVVVGGGDTAVEDAIYLSSICKTVTLIHRRNELRAAKKRSEYLKTLPNVKFIYDAQISAINGGDRLESVTVNGEALKTDGLFIAIGTVPVTDYLKDLPIERENGYIIADESCKTNIEGIFAAGDIRKKQLRQVVTAVADGANAAYSTIDYLKSI